MPIWLLIAWPLFMIGVAIALPIYWDIRIEKRKEQEDANSRTSEKDDG